MAFGIVLTCTVPPASAQNSTRHLTTIDALRRFSGYFHLQNVVLRGEFVENGRRVSLRGGDSEMQVILNDVNTLEGPVEVRGQLIDVGRLTAADYEDDIAHDPRIDVLRAKMEVKENTTFTKEYYERDKRHIGNALHIFFSDGSPKLELRIDFPIGHRKRRAEGMPVLVQKFEASVAAHFPEKQSESIKALFARKDFDAMTVNEFMAQLVANGR